MFEGKHVSFWIESIYDVDAIDRRANITNFNARARKACSRSVDVINKENEFGSIVPKAPLSTAVQCQFAALGTILQWDARSIKGEGVAEGPQRANHGWTLRRNMLSSS